MALQYILLSVLSVLGFLYGVSKVKAEPEPYLFIQLVWYVFLGSFQLVIQGIIIPIGLVILLFHNPALNRRRKRAAMFMGLAFMLIFHLIK